MKTKSFLATLMAVMLLLSSIAVNTVYASNDTKTATLNSMKVSVNGGSPLTIQTYMIDGRNYVRAREITNLLNMDILGKPTGITIKPYADAQVDTPMEKLVDGKITVTMQNGTIHYSGYDSITTSYFNYKDRNYFMLADMGKVAQIHKANSVEMVKTSKTPPLDSESVLKMFTIDWNANTSTVLIQTETINLLDIYNNKNGSTTVSTTSPTPPPTVTEQPKTHTVLPEYKSADEIPQFPAKIMIDPNKGGVLSNLTYPYSRLSGNIGECVWYGFGRFYEVYGINLMTGTNAMTGDKSNWINLAKDEKRTDIDGIAYLGNFDLINVPNRGLAVWTGHVVFIEFVERDENGKPIKIYFTEANAGSATETKGEYDPEYDGRIKSADIDNGFLEQSGEQNFIGFIVPKK